MGESMIQTIQALWVNRLGIGHAQARRRKAANCLIWGREVEEMESRALLSAVCLQDHGKHAGAVAAETSTSVPRAATFAYPNVQGQWTANGNGTAGVATLTQTKAKVTATFNLQGFAIKMVASFKKDTPNELSGTAKIPNPLTGKGKLAIGIHITFGAGSNPTSFTGQVMALGESIPLTGLKN